MPSRRALPVTTTCCVCVRSFSSLVRSARASPSDAEAAAAGTGACAMARWAASEAISAVIASIRVLGVDLVRVISLSPHRELSVPAAPGIGAAGSVAVHRVVWRLVSTGHGAFGRAVPGFNVGTEIDRRILFLNPAHKLRFETHASLKRMKHGPFTRARRRGAARRRHRPRTRAGGAPAVAAPPCRPPAAVRWRPWPAAPRRRTAAGRRTRARRAAPRG